MANKLETFLTENKISEKRIISASRQIERLRPEDRAIKLKLRLARKSEDGKKPEGLAKPRSGRTLTPIALQRAMTDGSITGPQKTRILRAVNRILEQKKKEAVAFDALFDITPKRPAKAEAEAEA